jgi:hypothetical protein
MCNNIDFRNEQPKPTCNCANFERNLEMVGYIHTTVMEKVGEHPDFPQIKPQEHYELVLRETRKLFKNAGFEGIEFPDFDTEFRVIGEIQNLKPEDYIKLQVEEGKFSYLGGLVLTEILAILDKNVGFRQKAILLRELAGYVRNMTTISEKEKQALLVGLHIGESSANFWKRVLADKKSHFVSAVRHLGLSKARLPWADIISGTVNCLGCSGGGFAGCIGCASISSPLGCDDVHVCK